MSKVSKRKIKYAAEMVATMEELFSCHALVTATDEWRSEGHPSETAYGKFYEKSLGDIWFNEEFIRGSELGITVRIIALLLFAEAQGDV